MDIDSAVFWIVLVAMLIVVLPSIAVYVMEVRRSGRTPWPEWHNDQLVLLKPSRTATRNRTDRTTPGRPSGAQSGSA